MKTPYNRNWDEFDWEREIRDEETRIHTYMQELRHYIDLPNEEEMIMKRLQRYPELITQSEEFGDMWMSDFFEEFDDDYIFSDDWRKKDGSDVYLQLEKLAAQWAVIFASALDDKNASAGMRILCLYGKMLARTADILDVTTENYPSLKVALDKRLVNEINKIIGELDALGTSQSRLSIRTEAQKSHLLTIREKLLDILEKSRKQNQ